MSQSPLSASGEQRAYPRSLHASRSSSGMRSPSTSYLLKYKVELESRILYLRRQKEIRREKKSMYQYNKYREELALRNNYERLYTLDQIRNSRKEQEYLRKQTTTYIYYELDEKLKSSKASMIESKVVETQQTKHTQQELLAYGYNSRMSDSMKRKQLHDDQKQFEVALKESKDQKIQDRLERTKQSQYEYRQMDERAKETAYKQLEMLRQQEEQLLNELEQEQ